MNNIEMRRPRIEDTEELLNFFRIVLIDTFAKEGLADLHDEIDEEIETKIKYLQSDFEGIKNSRYFLVALDGNKIIGTIEHGLASELINQCTKGELKNLHEIGTVFVLPEYQKQGVGTLLLNEMYNTLKRNGIYEFCLDSGYTNAQKVWKKKFGEPDYLIKDYWGEGFHHMIWKKRIDDITI